MRIQGMKSYRKEFSDPRKRESAYRTALQTRQFEIELYWKRATYFWTLIAASFAGYFALASADKSGTHPGLLSLVSCIGLVLSTGWYLVNRGSKYWQQNWESHVDALEDEFAGPLYKTTRTIANEEFCWWKPHDGYPFSVSKVNQLISLFVALVWFALAIFAFAPSRLRAWLSSAEPYILAGFTLLFLCILIFWWGKGGSQGRDRLVDFYKSALVPQEPDDPSKSSD
jgi:Na+/melibiose symporter-like transporter